MTYSDKYGEFFGRRDEDGNIAILHVSGEAATRLDASVYPVGQPPATALSARYEHADGIVLTPEDATKLGIEIED